MIPGLCFGFKNCKKLPIIQQRQAPVATHVLKAAFSKYVLIELRHFYIIALLYQPRIPRFFVKRTENFLAVWPAPSQRLTLLQHHLQERRRSSGG